MLSPCPLCQLQRLVFAAVAILFGALAFFKSKFSTKVILDALIVILAIVGAAIAGRQVWLQYFAKTSNLACGASLEQLIAKYPIFDALQFALNGSRECATIDFQIFGLSLAVWSLLFFVAIVLFAIYLCFLQKKDGHLARL